MRLSHTAQPQSPLSSLLDKVVSCLLLQPSLLDVTLDSVRVLLLYPHRYNEISAWAVIGLAVRYALFLGLDHAARRPFTQHPTSGISTEEFGRLHVWYNLLRCDFNLMLTSGLPISLDLIVSSEIARPGGVGHRVKSRGRNTSGRRLDADGLKKLNYSPDELERAWSVRLADSESQHGQLPITSVRYRACPLLAARPAAAVLVDSIEASLIAAAQILISLSTMGEHYIAQLRSSDASSFPVGSFEADLEAVRRLRYAVDSTWISHTFAVTYLVLCYTRGTVDGTISFLF
ncbi:hypothetical protein BJX65DRAFT_300813 [Aspergillus insuetus]